jgi:hypothetical protein
MQGRQVYLYQSSLPYQAVSQPLESVLPDLYYSDDVIDELSLLRTTINRLCQRDACGVRHRHQEHRYDWEAYQSS